MTTTCGGCVAWAQAARVSLATLEQGQLEAAKAAKDYNAKTQEWYRVQSKAVSTQAGLIQLETDHAAYETKFGKLVDALNKLWAVTRTIKATLPLVEQAADLKKRGDLGALLSNSLVDLLAVKDLLSEFHVSIGGL